MSAGIMGYGISLPVHRVSTSEIQKTWENLYKNQVDSLLLAERGVLAPDEDVITLSYEAARRAIQMSGVPSRNIGALYVGSQTAPYVSKASASCLTDMLGIGPLIMCGDCQYSSKSGTMAMQIVMALVEAGLIDYGIAIGVDALSLHIHPGHPMEYTAAAGAAAFVIGKSNVIASLDATASFASDTCDYWRLDGDRYFMWGGTTMSNTEVAAPEHTAGAINAVLQKTGMKATDIQAIAIQQKDGVSSYSLGKQLGFSKEQVQRGTYAGMIGDCGAASALISLALILEKAREKDKLLLASYGWGAGSDAFLLTMKNNTGKCPAVETAKLLERKILITYAMALKYERKFDSPEFRASTFA